MFIKVKANVKIASIIIRNVKRQPHTEKLLGGAIKFGFAANTSKNLKNLSIILPNFLQLLAHLDYSSSVKLGPSVVEYKFFPFIYSKYLAADYLLLPKLQIDNMGG